ncbi:patatin-like phospholipase family protein [Dietzia alimentaria]|uniref:patatin-like phospholipase family protein n=1 Tax=Dietzia alimentaria TaxID=665550 RepID=UPI000299F330|nr:patatin family protein [Dietzia alimentaria]
MTDTGPTGLEPTAPDVALLFEGGGMRAVHTAGVVETLIEADIYAGLVGGISAGASHLANYVSRDAIRARKSFVEMAADPNFGDWRSFARGKGLFNAEYIYEQAGLPDQALPYDFTTFDASETAVRIGTFRCSDGETVFWNEDDVASMNDLMRMVRSSSTMPVWMPPVLIDGEYYVDGALGHDGGVPLSAAQEAGFERFLVVLTQPKGYRKAPPRRLTPFYRSYFRRFPAVGEALQHRWALYNETLDEIEEMEEQGRAIVFRPDRVMIRSYERRIDRLAEAYTLGREQARREVDSWLDFCGL